MIYDPLKSIFQNSLSKAIFLDDLKVARVTAIFKSVLPISVLPYDFLKYSNRLFTYLIENDILYNKQFGFQKGYSRNHVIAQLSYEISQAFDHEYFTVGVFIDV